MTRSPRRPERFEVVVAGETHGVVVGLDGTVHVDGEEIGAVENTGRKIPRTSRWRATTPDGKSTSGYTAEDAAAALAYAVLRDRDLERARTRLARLKKVVGERRLPPEDVCPICGDARDRCECRPEDHGLDL